MPSSRMSASRVMAKYGREALGFRPWELDQRPNGLTPEALSLPGRETLHSVLIQPREDDRFTGLQSLGNLGVHVVGNPCLHSPPVRLPTAGGKYVDDVILSFLLHGFARHCKDVRAALEEDLHRRRH